MIRITTRKDVGAQIDGYAEEAFYDDLCDAVWDALGRSLGEAVRVAPSGAVSYYKVSQDSLEGFCRAFAQAH